MYNGLASHSISFNAGKSDLDTLLKMDLMDPNVVLDLRFRYGNFISNIHRQLTRSKYPNFIDTEPDFSFYYKRLFKGN